MAFGMTKSSTALWRRRRPQPLDIRSYESSHLLDSYMYSFFLLQNLQKRAEIT